MKIKTKVPDFIQKNKLCFERLESLVIYRHFVKEDKAHIYIFKEYNLPHPNHSFNMIVQGI